MKKYIVVFGGVIVLQSDDLKEVHEHTGGDDAFYVYEFHS